MAWLDVFWSDENKAHLRLHGVSPQEAEYVIHNPIASDVSDSTDRPIVFGYTVSGRKLAVVYEFIDAVTVYPITAYDVE